MITMNQVVKMHGYYNLGRMSLITETWVDVNDPETHVRDRFYDEEWLLKVRNRNV